MNYFLGIDIGTTATKAVAFSETGAVLASVSNAYEMNHPQPEFSEQNPDEIVNAVVQGIKQVLQQLAPALPQFIAFSAAMHSLIAVNDTCTPLTACIIWADNRAAAFAEQLKNSEKGLEFYQASGVPVHSMSPLCKLLWLRENEPDIFKNAGKFIGIKEYLFYKLFGRFVIDTSLASATGLLNIRSLQWDETILQYTGIEAGRLSEIVSPKQMYYYDNKIDGLTLPDNLPFIIGASDGALSNLGTGATGSGCMAINIGTSSAARVLLPAVMTDAQMRTFCYHAKDNLYITGGAGNNGAVVLQWLQKDLLQTTDDFSTLIHQAESIAPGCEGLLMLPYILGERSPIWNAAASGVFFGLSIRNHKAHLIRATLEGVIYSIYSIGKVVLEKNSVQEIRATGGFAHSALWVQLLADVFNLKVLVSGTTEGTALGAVILGKEAMNIDPAFADTIAATYLPDAGRHAVYQQCFAQYQRLYEILKGEMKNEPPADSKI